MCDLLFALFEIQDNLKVCSFSKSGSNLTARACYLKSCVNALSIGVTKHVIMKTKLFYSKQEEADFFL